MRGVTTVFGELSKHTAFRLLVFMLLVWLTVDLGKMLPVFFPQMPLVIRKVLDPSTGDANTKEMTHL